MNHSDANLLMSLRYYYDAGLSKPNPSLESIFQAKEVMDALSKVSIVDLMAYFVIHEEDWSFSPSDIPQFSSLDDCWNVIDKLVRSGLDGVNYKKIGFFLRAYPKKEMADQKYGENHIKCAALMGLCVVNKGGWKNAFSYAYECLSDQAKKSLIAKLCLGIRLIRGYFIQGQSDIFLENALNCLSESTKKRRLSNIKLLIEIVKSELL